MSSFEFIGEENSKRTYKCNQCGIHILIVNDMTPEDVHTCYRTPAPDYNTGVGAGIILDVVSDVVVGIASSLLDLD